MADTTKEKIIENALALFRKNGYDNTTLNDICVASSINKNTFYYHFKSKEDVLCGVATLPHDLSAGDMEKLLDAPSCYDQFKLVFSNMLNHINSLGPQIAHRVFMHMRHHGGRFPEKGERPLQMMRLQRSILQKGQRAGEFRNQSDADELLYCLQNALHGVIMAWSMGAPYDLKNAHNLTIETILDVRPDLRIASGDYLQAFQYNTESSSQ